MAKFAETTTYTINCPVCESDHVVKDGKQSGEQRYKCKPCQKKFRAGGKAKGKRMDSDMVGSAIRDYYSGKSYKQIAEGLKDEYDLPNEPSKASIYEWVKEYTDKALGQVAGHKAKTGGHWVADEMVVKVGGKKAYNWNVIDKDTRYILASHLSYRRDGHAARAAIRKAAQAAASPPKSITTDKWRAYIKPTKDILPEAKHLQSEGLSAELNNNLSERLQGTFRDRIKTLRGMDSIKTGQRYLDGWVLTYNHFRKHESLGDKTPGSKAKVSPPFKEWADVVKVGAASRSKVKTEKRPSQSSPKLKPLKADQDEKKPKPRKARKKPRIKPPEPVFPKVGNSRRTRSRVPRWAKVIPRLPGRN